MDFTKTIKTLKLLLATVLVGSASLSANAGATFTDSASGLNFSFNYDGSNTCSVSSNTSASGDITIPSTVTYNDTEYRVTAIGNRAFYNCTTLTSVTIPESVTSIKDYAFYECTSLTSIIIPESVTSIGQCAILGCSALTSIAIPESVTSIGINAFQGCSGLTKVEITNLEAWCKIDFGSSNFNSNPLSFAHHLYLNGNEITDLVIPESITEIKNYTFYGCSTLTSVNIHSGVTSIGKGAFSGCSLLTSMTIPESVTYIGGAAFSGCTALESINIPQKVTVIERSTFYGTSLININIPEGVTSIGQSAFQNCKSLTTVNLPQSLTSIGALAFASCTSLVGTYTNKSLPDGYEYELVIPNNVTSIGESAFEDCTSLVYLDLGEGVETIGKRAFKDCTSLLGTYTNKFTGEYQNVLIIPNSVKTIGEISFDYCLKLENIWIGTGCTSIGYWAFSYDNNIETVSCMANPAPIIQYQDAFTDITYQYAYLYIPAGATDEETKAIYDDYVSESNYWRLFLKGASTYDADGNNGISVGVGEVADDDIAVTTDGKAIEITGYEGEVNVYNVAGMRVYQGNDNRIELTNPGIYVVVVNGKSYKVAIK